MRTIRYRRRMRPFHIARQKWSGACWTAGVVFVLIFLALHFANVRIQPIIQTMSMAKVNNQVTRTIECSIAQRLALENTNYFDMVTVEKDSAGHITALSSDINALNRLRTEILSAVVSAVEGLEPEELDIPLGNISGLSFLADRGATIPVRILSVGTVEAEFQNLFTGSGINQTRHQIMFYVTATLHILIPGQTLETTVTSSIPVAETVIIGQIPDTYLQFEQSR